MKVLYQWYLSKLIPDDSNYFMADPLQSLEKGDSGQLFVTPCVPFKASNW